MYSKNFFQTHFVNNRGIASFCDAKPSTMTSDIVASYLPDYERVNDWDLVYVISSALPHWFRFVYPSLKQQSKKIFLVTGDSDISTPNEALASSDVGISQIIQDNVIQHWFAQNLDRGDDDFFSHLPIGIDYHTLDTRSNWGEPRTDFSSQDRQLRILSDNAKKADWSEREIWVFSDTHLTAKTNPEDRLTAYHSLKDKPFMWFLPAPVSRSELWRLMATSKFVLSPLGNGLDCHRTWEAIALGCVPIIKRTSLAPLFEGLPVIQVNEYEDINLELLEAFDHHRGQEYEKMTLQFWRNFISQKCNDLMSKNILGT